MSTLTIVTAHKSLKEKDLFYVGSKWKNYGDVKYFKCIKVLIFTQIITNAILSTYVR